MEDAIVLYASPGMSHLMSLVELGKFILSHHPTLSIHILLPAAPNSSTATYVSTLSASINIVKFHHLPTVQLPPSIDQEMITIETIRLSSPHVQQSLLDISQTHTVRACILDPFCFCALSVTSGLNIPTYFYFTSGAGSLVCFLYFQTLHNTTTKSLKDLGKILLDMPGIPPIPAREMPSPLLDRINSIKYQFFLDFSISLPKSAGIISNTFEALEPRSVKAIRDGLCVPDQRTPPLYCMGPLIAVEDQRSGHRKGGVPECLTWLDSQPAESVIFLCFGSMGEFSKEQLREIALGLEKSGQRFLWVVRNPPSNNEKRDILCPVKDPEDLESLLPEGFLERTKGRGLIVKRWAPQIAILNHDAVGGFVTHCGWNSVLEALWAGVPMVAWPLYAEQRINRILLVEEMKIAIPMEESDDDGFVGWDEVEKRAKELMGSKKGELVRERVIANREAAKAALREGGSSLVDLDKFIHFWERG